MRRRRVKFLLALFIGSIACAEVLEYDALQFEVGGAAIGPFAPTLCGALQMGSGRCAACTDSMCCGAATECGEMQDCAGLVVCRNGCQAGDVGCLQGCAADYAAGASSFLPLTTCLRAACASVCEDSGELPGTGGTGGQPTFPDAGDDTSPPDAAPDGTGGTIPDPGCGMECADGSYTPCTCSASDPCGWAGDGYCDVTCERDYPSAHFDDSEDCVPAGSGGGTGTGGTSGSAGSDVAGHTCSMTESGATGAEPGGVIPVCCAPTVSERGKIETAFALLNAHRAANGVAPLVYDSLLEAAMQGHCVHMAVHSFFAHTAPEPVVSSPWDRAALCGTSAGAENIADGHTTAESVMQSWIGSPGHNQNMLDGGYTRVGIGYVDGSWGQLFGN